MRLPLRNELQELLKQSVGHCISLFMPTYRTSTVDRRQGPRQLTNILENAREQLVARGLRRADAETLLSHAWQLTKETTYWHNGLADGLAVFISNGLFREYKVPLALDEKLYVDNRFHITPLLPLYSGDTRFYILCLSQKEVRLFEGTRHDIHELEPKGVPANLVDALTRVENGGTRPGQLHNDRFDQLGQGAGLEHVNHRLTRFFREVDTNLMHLIGGDSAPMVLAGVERNVGLYRQTSAYKKILDGFIEENPQLDNPKNLHAEALAIVEPYFRETERVARQQFEKFGGTARVSTDPCEIVTAAENGRIDTLFLSPGHEVWGRFDSAQNATELHDRRQDGDTELASLAAEQTFLNGGAVFYCNKDQTPRKTPMAALLRY
jgi:hypothetical protein